MKTFAALFGIVFLLVASCGGKGDVTCGGFTCDAGQICLHEAALCPRCFPELAPGQCSGGQTHVVGGVCGDNNPGCEQDFPVPVPQCASEVPATCAPACGSNCGSDVVCSPRQC
jgi:hypothetical protein